MKNIRELDVFKIAEILSDMVWFDYDKWPKKAQVTIGYQVIKASDSISANLSEGYGRYTPPDRKRFYYFSRESFEETKTWLYKAARRKVIDSNRIEEYKQIINELGPKLNGFINSSH